VKIVFLNYQIDFAFAVQPHSLPPSSLYPFSSFALLSAGEVDKIVLPEGMQSVNFQRCERLTGTAELEEEVIFSSYVLAASRTHFLLPHFILPPVFLSFSCLVALSSFSQVTLHSCIFPWA
jgi:hypothetical protein